MSHSNTATSAQTRYHPLTVNHTVSQKDRSSVRIRTRNQKIIHKKRITVAYRGEVLPHRLLLKGVNRHSLLICPINLQRNQTFISSQLLAGIRFNSDALVSLSKGNHRLPSLIFDSNQTVWNNTYIYLYIFIKILWLRMINEFVFFISFDRFDS